ncbi:PREDICTED: rho guanine nucleotide exchange factor 11-like, partial [Pseudopodoces humilis]|uniref:rho guanine nucleotide exchange factor 11-like n=1 Tax=Pseudopodoces humilis TaxID=181119 RepID=UPI0006B833FD
MIQHFEGGADGAESDPGPRSRSGASGTFQEPPPAPSSRSEVRLGRSESLKGREELRRCRRCRRPEPVPRSRSDADVDGSGSETPRLHSASSSSASSLSNRSLENPTPPYTPKTGRRSLDSPSPADPFLPHLPEDEQGPVPDPEPNSQSWQHSVSRELVANLSQRELDRQEVINELMVTELSHLRVLRALDVLFYQRLRREQLLSPHELGLLFPNLPDLIAVHNSLWESMKKLRDQGPIIREIGDVMLARFEGDSKEEFQRVAAAFCSSQSVALELIRTKQPGSPEREKLFRAREQSRAVLSFVNEAVRGAENRRRLREHQRRLDSSALERSSNPLAAQFRNLDLTSHRMIHEGPLAWRVGKDKSV